MRREIKKFISILENRFPFIIRILVLVRSWFFPIDLIQAQKSLKWKVKEYQLDNRIDIPDLTAWCAAFSEYLKVFPRNIVLINSFFDVDMKSLSKVHPNQLVRVIGVCVVKNDLERLSMVVQHHRTIGVKHFVVIDNGSTDGTVDWLTAQPDIDVYQVLMPFESLKKYGWINRILAKYGMNQWYLYFDSDEKLVDPDQCIRDLDSLVSSLEHRGLDRLGALMVDMYSDGELYSDDLEDHRSLNEKFVYFDRDSYVKSYSKRGLVIKGGPRKRMFSENSSDSPLLIKFPLFKLSPGMIFESAHYLFPFASEIPLALALLHYKFTPGDLDRHRDIVQKGNFQGGSREYRRYISKFNESQHLSFMYSGSEKFISPASLKAIKYFDQIN